MKPLRFPTFMRITALLSLSMACIAAPAQAGPAAQSDAHAAVSTPAAQTLTCSMHPQIRQPKPGKCPICGMNLIPVATSDSAATGPRQVAFTPNALALAEVETTPVVRKLVPVDVRLLGMITFDESRQAHLTARVGGRLDRMYVDYTGVHVNKGDHLVHLYSQDLYVMQAEYLISRRAGNTAIASSRNRLLLSGLAEQQVQELERTGEPQLYIDLFSPLSGTVVEKEGVEGMYIETGAKIYTITDLSHLWLMLEAYESDLPWIRYGQPAEFSVEAYPGITFTGRVTFISPILNEMTRTVSVRVNVPNSDGRLKPGFLANAVVRSAVASGDNAMDPSLAGKWTCPMHREFIRDVAGACDLCGMALVSVESLGYHALDESRAEAPLVIPLSAALITGTRAVAYVAVSGKPGMFEGREITLGPRAGDYYLVRAGLAEGELVVTRGAFKIDSTAQILAKPSMMNPEAAAGAPDPPSVPAPPAAARVDVNGLVTAYLAVQQALAHDDLAAARAGASAVSAAVEAALARAPAQTTFLVDCKRLKLSSVPLAAATDIAAARLHFAALSAALINIVAVDGPGTQTLYQTHCPMAFDGKGADWLQPTKTVANPYFGASMLSCGDVTKTYR